MWLLSIILAINPGPLVTPKMFGKKVTLLTTQGRVADSFWGIQVYAPLRGKVIYEQFPNHNFRPASNMKILTTLLGLDYLGPDFQYQTAVYHTGRWDRKTGILEGDLIIEGRGDPSISGNFFNTPGFTIAILNSFLKHLKSMGLDEIRGNLIGVNGYFDKTSIQKSWEWDDMGRSYGTPVNALSLNDAWIQLTFSTNASGEPNFSFHPPGLTDVEVRFNTEPIGSEPNLTIKREWGTNAIDVSGKFPPCSESSTTLSSWRPQQHFLEVFAHFLKSQSVSFTGSLITTPEMPEQPRTLIKTLDSPNLATISQRLMKHSQNHYADCVFKTVAKEVTGEGSFEAGAKVADTFIQHAMTTLDLPHAEFLGIHIRDGSGLSAQNYLRPAYLVALLRYGLEQPYAPQWLETLPILGADGTLSRRGLENSPAKGRVWAKTGYIYRARTLSGYCLTTAGEPLVFSIMTNNYSSLTADINRIQDHICDLMVRLKPNRKVRKNLENAPPEWLQLLQRSASL